MTYVDAISWLSQARRFGMKLGLEPMRALADALANPQRDLRFIHIAGTNGKGSTAAFCESCLRAAGFRVGLYTSPHLVSARERFQIDRVLISEAEFAAGMATVQAAVAKAKIDPPTFFEITTALALWYFAKEKVDWVVWETGLGGRLDATNIVDPAICIITNIGLEHQQYLGGTLTEIATEKAGIIKPGVPVVCGAAEGEAADVIRERAMEGCCSFMMVQRDSKLRDLGVHAGRQLARMGQEEYELGLIGAHQIENAAGALETMRQLDWMLVRDNWEHVEVSTISHDAITRGLAQTKWPGRFEVISDSPLIVLDGAHNPFGIAALVETWRAFISARFGASATRIDDHAHIIFACTADKNIMEMAKLLRPIANHISLVRLASDRGAEPSEVAQHFGNLPHTIHSSVAELWRSLTKAPLNQAHLACGSLFLVGEMLAQQQGNAEEYELNERLEVFTTTAKI